MHARMALEATVHDPGTMGCQTIPNQNNRSLQMTRELTQEVSDLWGSNTLFRMQPEAQGNPISAGPNTQSGHNRDMLVGAHALGRALVFGLAGTNCGAPAVPSKVHFRQ